MRRALVLSTVVAVIVGAIALLWPKEEPPRQPSKVAPLLQFRPDAESVDRTESEQVAERGAAALRIARERDALRPDLKLIEEYGTQHEEDWAGAQFVDSHPVTLVAAFHANTLRHEQRLRALVAMPQLLDVHGPPRAARSLEELRDEVGELLTKAHVKPAMLGLGYGGVVVALDETEEALADELYRAYRTALILSVGAFSYPPERAAQRGSDTCRPLRAPTIATPGLDFSLAQPTSPVGREELMELELTIRNTAQGMVTFTTDQPLDVSLVDPRTSRTVNAAWGVTTGTGLVLPLSSGQTAAIPLSIKFASCNLVRGYAVGPGSYLLAIEVPVYATWASAVSQTRVVTGAVPITFTG